MEELTPPPAVHGRGVSAVHVILVILILATLGGVGYVAWMTQIQSDVLAERTTGTEAEVAQLRSELAESQRMLAEEKAKAPAPSDVVIYENATAGFRVVTAPGCAGVYTVRPGQPMPELGADARWDIFVPRSQDWATNPIRAFLRIDGEVLAGMQTDPANADRPDLHQLSDGGSIPLLTDPRPGTNLRLYQFLGGDGPSFDEIKSADGGGACPYVLQTIPRLQPEAG